MTTLNFSHRPIFPANPSEDHLVSSIRIANGYVVEGIPDKNGDGFGKPRRFNWEIEDSYDCRRDRADRGGPREPISNDILDILPSDPFGMDISATFTAITGWIEDMEADSENYVRDDTVGKKGDYQFVAGLNFFWNRAMRFQTEPVSTGIGERSNPVGWVDGWVEEKDFADGSCDGGFVSVCNMEEFLSFGDDDSCAAIRPPHHSHEAAENCPSGEGEAPHDALLFALRYLGVQDLLCAEKVCRTMRSAVQNDPLLWTNIHIDQPLNERITDDALIRLTSRAQGNLQSLSLVECSRIADDGVKRVLQTNPRLKKVSVPGCTRLSVAGIVNNLKAFKSSSAPGIKQLRIGGLYGVTNEHYEELKLIVGLENCQQPKAYKARFYHNAHLSLSCDDDRAIDIEMCPGCQNLRLVYDCPSESCQAKQGASDLCRACTLCIARCVQCGRCINDSEYVETFCLDLLCSSCWKQLLNCPERQEEKGVPSKHTIFHQETRYHFRLYG
ncbi:F-box protein SKIP14-like isoform X2 [Telopea speciosissima]|uniref:F-box protein SKIP14-like isoform X2 n=1 Tax=Telopea speciosissima TaxID=54955 RepID=UPI001CC777C1|nr:F-box protein SKIP14-like isoform X2 [Telopea speciosissima]